VGTTRLLWVSLLLAVAGSGCAGKPALEQRTTEGPTAEQAFAYRIAQQNGREPTFEERQTWKDELDLRVARYLNANPEDANALGVLKFRHSHQVTVGMSKEQVTILLGPPAGVTTEAERMAELARKYWDDMKDRTTEAWSYPLGWSFYFSGDRLVEITQYVP
jgi:hypothetical protein